MTYAIKAIKSECCSGSCSLTLMLLFNALSLKGVVSAAINSIKEELLISPANGRT